MIAFLHIVLVVFIYYVEKSLRHSGDLRAVLCYCQNTLACDLALFYRRNVYSNISDNYIHMSSLMALK